MLQSVSAKMNLIQPMRHVVDVEYAENVEIEGAVSTGSHLSVDDDTAHFDILFHSREGQWGSFECTVLQWWRCAHFGQIWYAVPVHFYARYMGECAHFRQISHMVPAHPCG